MRILCLRVAIVIVIALPIPAVAQTIYGIRFVPASGNVGIYSIDPATGVAALITDTGVSGVLGSATAFDPVGGRYFFVSDGGELITVNVASSGVMHVAGSMVELQYDPLTANLYGIRFVPGSGNVGIYAMSPATGISVLIADTGLPGYADAAAFDPVGRRYFFVSGDGSELFTVNVANSGVTHVTGSMAELHYDSLTGNLYGIRFVPGSGNVGIYTMSPATGIPVLIADTGVQGYSGSETAFDPVGRRYFFVSDSGELFTVNVAGGTFSHVTGALAEMEYGLTNVAAIPLFGDLTILLMVIALLAVGLSRLPR
jgi:hypothetical protein